MSPYPYVSASINFVPAGIRAPEARYVGSGGEAKRNYEAEGRSVRIANGRLLAEELSIDVQGFDLIHAPTRLGPVTDDSDPVIARDYHPEVEGILKKHTGADEIVLFDHTIRIASNEAGRLPVMHAHNDYTESSAPKRVADLIGATAAERWFRGRVAQVNLWRPLRGPVKALPLALADARSLGPADLRETALVFDDRVGQIYHLDYNPAQRWTYFPEMTPDEAILIKGYDSATDGRSRFTPHTAFADPSTPPDAPARHSIEARAFLFFDA